MEDNLYYPCFENKVADQLYSFFVLHMQIVVVFCAAAQIFKLKCAFFSAFWEWYQYRCNWEKLHHFTFQLGKSATIYLKISKIGKNMMIKCYSFFFVCLFFFLKSKLYMSGMQ